MILPILRLVLIYFLLVAGVVAVFNRDKLAPLLPGARDRETAQAEARAPLAETPVADPATGDGDEAAPEAGGQMGAGPVFPEPTDLGAPEAADGASAAAAPAPAQPATPGSPAPLGTPVATPPATETAAAPVAPTSPATPEDAATAPTAPTAMATPEAESASASEALAAPVAPVGDAQSEGDPTALADAIAAARAAYWSGDIESARARMEALVAAHPDNPDVAGELGNLAFALRDYPAAADAWHRAGQLLIERGENARVMSFLPFLQSIAPDKAAELAARLQDR